MNKHFNYEFKLQVQKVYLKIPSECSVQIWWRRGKGKTTTKNPVKLKGGEAYFKVNQPLAIQGKCVYKNGEFESKESLIQIVIFNYDNTTKLGGSCVVDLTKIISPTNISMNLTQNFELPLENTPDKNAKIFFTLSVRFLGQSHDDSAVDISFQANSPNQTSNMTFRPSSRQRKPSVRKNNTQQNFFKNPQSPLQLQSRQPTKRQQPQYPPKHNQRPMEFSFNPTVNPEKQNKAQMELISELRQDLNEKNKEIQGLRLKIGKLEENERRQYTNTNEKALQLMNELNSANTKLQQAKRQVKDLQKQLSFTQSQNDSIRGEKLTLRKQLQRLNQQSTTLTQSLQHFKSQSLHYKSLTQQMTKRLQVTQQQKDQLKEELFKKQSQYITLENKYEKEITGMKVKNSTELEVIEGELKELKGKIDMLYQENLQLKRESSEGNRKVLEMTRQNQQLKKVINDRTKELEKFNSQQYKLQQELQTIKKSTKQLLSQKQHQKHLSQQKLSLLQQKHTLLQQKYALLQQRFREKQQLLQQIEFQFHHLQSTNQKEKDNQVMGLREKLISAQRRVSDLDHEKESQNIMISELKVRIKNLQSACDNLEKEMDEKEELIQQKENIIEKAKVYVKQKEKEIEQRDQFISNAKKFVQEREKQFQQEKKRLQQHLQTITSTTSISSKQTQTLKRKISQLSYQLQTLQISLTDKETLIRDRENLLKDKENQLLKNQKYLKDCSMQINQKIERIEDLEHYIQSLQQRIEITQEQLQEVSRKNKGLNETLEEVVRKNFQMEIQLNIKNAQLQAVRSYVR